MSAFKVDARGLHKEFDGKHALEDVSFSVGEGEIFGLLGPNGAGKTTALHILLGILRPTRGEVSVLGRCPQRERYRIYPRINYTSAYVQLPFNLSVGRNLRIFAELYGVADAGRKVSGLMELLDIGHLASVRTGALSSGEQTRLNLCKSLLNDPELLFLDEPTASLDPDMADRVRALLQRVREERRVSMIYTSHNMAEVERLCDRVLFLHRGRKIAEGTPGELRRRFSQDSLEKLFLKLSREGELRDVKGENA